MMYQQQGVLPEHKHTLFKQKGKMIYEELFSTEGFSSFYSTLYHREPPTNIKGLQPLCSLSPTGQIQFRYWHLITSKLEFNEERIKTLLFNHKVKIGLCCMSKKQVPIFKNADANELFFVHKGRGHLDTPYGSLAFSENDYLYIPKGTYYQLKIDSKARFFYVEAKDSLRFPKEFLTPGGQFLESSPICERNIRTPKLSEPQKGKLKVLIKNNEWLYEAELHSHPFDVVGWDGCLYPFALNLKDYMPRVGKIHLPPPVHKIFESNSFVVCHFLPRLLDYHEKAITAPYYHSNIDSDEVLYYLDGDFLSRRGVSEGSLTLHPMGLPHGPQPGKQKESIGKKATNEIAVMVDTFQPLSIADDVLSISDEKYLESWVK